MKININECEDTRGAGPGHKTISGRAPVWCDAGDLYFSVLTLSDEDMRHIRHCPGDQRQCDRGFGFGTEFSWAWASWPGPPRQPRRPWPALGVAWRVSQNSERKCNEDGFIISIQAGIACLSWNARAGLDRNILLWSLYQTIRLNRIINCSFQNVTILRNHFLNLFLIKSGKMN